MQCNGFVLPFSAYSQLTNSFRSRQAAPLATPTTETFQFLGFGAARGAPSVGSGLSRIPQVRVACLLYPGPFGLHSPFVARRLCGMVSCPTHVCSRCLLCACGSLARLIPFEAAGGDVTLACESPRFGRESALCSAHKCAGARLGAAGRSGCCFEV